MKVSPETVFGHYKILSQIGAGGMGEVFLAEDTRLRRKVALKVLPENIAADKERLLRFEREAHAASALNHPNILTIFEFGAEGETHFLAAEFVKGETLRDRFLRDSLTLSETLDIAVQIASALQAAHEAGIVHRDIKPENVMVRPDGLVKILDFGIAKLAEMRSADFGMRNEEAETLLQSPQNNPQSAIPNPQSTTPGMIIGTADYMSPEQARGKPIDARSDIFSFGIVLYEMLSGKKAFAGETTMDALGAILHKEPAPISQLMPDVPQEIERIINKTLKKDRDGRYQTAKDLLTDLKSLQRRIEFEAEFGVSPSDGNRSEQKTQILEAKITNEEKPLISGALNTNSIAVLPFANLSNDAENEYFCDGLAEELLNALAKIDDLKVAARTSAFSFKGKNTNVSEVGNILKVKTVLEGSVRKSGNKLRITVQLINAADGYHLWSERFDREMKDIFDVQDEITLAVVDALKVKLLGTEKKAVLKRYTDNTDAYRLYLNGRFFWNKRTKESLKSAVEYFNQAVAVDPSYALAYAGLADCYVLFTYYDVAPPGEAYPKARAAAQKALEIDDTLGEVLVTLAVVKEDYEWDFAGAERDFQKAIALNPNYPTAHQWYGEFLAQMGRKDESIAELRHAQELDPLSLIINKVLGGTLLFARRYDEAIAQNKKLLEMDANFAPAHTDLGWCYTEKGMHDEAIAEFQKAVALTNGNPSQLAGLAYAFAKSGKQGEAQKILEQLKERQKNEYVDSASFAIIHVALGEKDKAFASLEKSYQEHSVGMLSLKGDPRFDDLRDDIRFQDLLRRVGLPQ